jgi:hypothetical protein
VVGAKDALRFDGARFERIDDPPIHGSAIGRRLALPAVPADQYDATFQVIFMHVIPGRPKL